MLTTPNQPEANALNQLISRRLVINWELSAYLLILLLAIVTRFALLDQRVMSHDESLHTRFSYNLYNEGNFSHTPLMHGPLLFHATALSYFLFGDSDYSGRLYTAVLGALMVMFPLLWRRWLGRWGALLASLMILCSPLLLYYHRYIRHDTPSILFGLIMAHCILMYLNGPPRQRRRAYWLYILAAAMILNLASKETAFIYIVIFSSFLCIYFMARLAQHRWRWHGNPLFSAIMLGILLGGLMTLGLYIVVDIVPVAIIAGGGTPFADLSDLQRSSLLSWSLLTLLAAFFALASTALYAWRGRRRSLPWREIGLIFTLALLVAGGLLFIEELSHLPSAPQTAEPALPDAADPALEGAGPANPINWMPLLPLWMLLIICVPLLLRDARRAARDRAASLGEKRRPGFWGWLYPFPEVDIIVLIGTLILPWLTAIFPRLMGGGRGEIEALARSLPAALYNLLSAMPSLGGDESIGRFVLGSLAFLPLFILMIAIGLSWNWRRWLVSALVFHLLFALFFTTVFTNISGLASGMIYSLGYWLEQQGVRRGSQPQYYYLLIIMPVYEFLPVIGAVTAMFAALTAFWKRRRRQLAQLLNEAENAAIDSPTAESSAASATEADPLIDGGDSDPTGMSLRRLPFLLLLAWWAVLSLVGYSLAGEKMPWLGTHLTTPLILLTAWYFGGVFARIDKSLFLARGWMALLILPVFLLSLAVALGAFLIGDPPFAGLSQDQLERTYQWLGAVIVAAGLGLALMRIARSTGWLHVRRLAAVAIFGLLSLFTFRAAWMASFVNYDLPTEFLVYAHAAPAVKWVLDDIEEMSYRITDGRDLKFAYDNEVSWPYSWYFRDFSDAVFVGDNPTIQNLEGAVFVVVGAGHRGDVEPILEDRYYRHDHIRMWWPMQEYFGLTPERILNALDFSPGNPTAAQIRRGMFDIWWARNYNRYGAATFKDFSLTNWPVSDHMHIYIHKDYAAQIWSHGLGEGQVAQTAASEINLCAANWQDLAPLPDFAVDQRSISQPIGLSAAQGIVYVADESRNQVLALGRDGQLLRSYGDGERVQLYRPNSAAPLADGSLLIVDTWNYRIRQLDAEGAPAAEWGQAGEFGFDAPREPDDGFWGPRDVAVDQAGNIYISDTGNKRVRVYRLDGAEVSHVLDIGTGGSGEGELNEPSGLALHSDGRLFVADTWNRRVAVFNRAGEHQTNFRVRGWYSSSPNRPYLALDEARGLLYITDPDINRVLVYNTQGECVGAFGQSGTVNAQGQFQAIAGIAVDDDGFVFVSDSSAGAVLKFPPFPQYAVPAG